MAGPPNVMGRFFLLLLFVAIIGMFFYHESQDTTVTQEEALNFQNFLAKQPVETPTETPKPTRVPGYGRPMFHAETDEEDKKKEKEEKMKNKKPSFEELNGEEDKFA
jgi:hypothetical protein